MGGGRTNRLTGTPTAGPIMNESSMWKSDCPGQRKMPIAA